MAISEELLSKQKAISVIGLGFVGLPLALEFAKKYNVIGFDTNAKRITQMQLGIDPSKELSQCSFKNRNITFTSDSKNLFDAHFHIIAVPTDIDEHKVPNLTPLLSATRSVGTHLKKGDYVVFESTVYPGCTEEECLPILEELSGLKVNHDFKIGYSPERIVPGDKVRTLSKILKVVSGSDAEALKEISSVYSSIIEAGIHEASSIKVAEAAKVIENTQRDINISLMNELAIIFDKIGIDTNEVLEAAATKWNFHKYSPGLVGGHCISADPFILLYKAKQLGHDPKLIAEGRSVNDYIPNFFAKTLVQRLIEIGKNPGKSKILVQGVTFKEDVSDIRNSKVVDLIRELKGYSIEVHVIDPHASNEALIHEYDLQLTTFPDDNYDAVVIAVAHQIYKDQTLSEIRNLMNEKPILFDLKRTQPKIDQSGLIYWTL